MKEERSRDLALAGALAAFVAALYWRVLVGGETFVLRDLVGFGVPSREFLAASLRHGRIPEWCDWMGLGGPFAANPIHSATYPPAWLVALLPMPLGADLLILAHLLFAAVGTALLARRLGASRAGAFVGGAILAASGYVVSVVPNGMAPIVAWTPWVGWAADRLAVADTPRERLRAGAWTAAVVAAQLVQGEPLSLAAAALLAIAVTLARAPRLVPAVARLAAAGAFAVPLAAATLVPAFELLRSSDRAAGLGERVGLAWSLHPLRIVESIWPSALGDPTDPASHLARLAADASSGVATEASWSTSLFLGAPALVLAGAAAGRARWGRILALFALAFLVLALGRFTPLYPALRAVAPVLAIGRYPEKLVVGTVVLASALAGVGFTALVEREERRTRARWVSAGAAAALALAVGALRSAGPDVAARWSAPGSGLDAARWLDAALGGGAVAAAGAALFALALFAPPSGRWATPARLAAGAAVLVPLAWAASAVTATAPRAVVSSVPALLEPVVPPADIASAAPRPRVFVSPWLGGVEASSKEALARTIRETAAGNAPSRFGLAVLPGADSARSAAVTRILELERFVPIEHLAGMLSARHLVVEWRRIQRATVLRTDPRMQAALVELPAAQVRPRAFVAPAWRWVDDETALRELVFPTGAAPAERGWVNLAGGGEELPADGRDAAAPTPCSVTQRSPEDVELECVAPLGGYAVLLDELAPGWTADVDGQPARIERADGLFRAVRLAPGIRRVRFEYRTPGLRLGAGIALAAWAALLAAVAWPSRAARRREGGGRARAA